MLKQLQKFFFLLNILCILFIRSAHADSKKAYEKVKPLIFQVKISANQNLEKSSYGTGFVISKDGLIVTNYHVVSDAIWEEEKNKVYVQINNELLEAKIKAVDFVNDLSIIQVDHQFDDTIKISHEKPERGTDLYSLGLPEDLDWTVVPGTYNGETSQGPYELIHMSSPINPGMSGGPTVNSNSELVGVNVSGLLFAQQISFAVPARFVGQLLEKVDKSKNPTQKDLLSSLERQLTKTQEKMTQVFLAGFANGKNIENVIIPSFSKKVRCWGHSQTPDEKKWYFAQGENCRIDQSVRLDDNTFTGTFMTEISLIKNTNMNPFAWATLLGEDWNDNTGAVTFFKKKKSVNFSQLKCIRNRVEGKNPDQPITIKLCFQRILPFENLYDSYAMIIIPIDEKNSLKADLTLAGFTMDNLKKIIKELLTFNYKGSKK